MTWLLSSEDTKTLDEYFYGDANHVSTLPVGKKAFEKRLRDDNVSISTKKIEYYYLRQPITQILRKPPIYYVPKSKRPSHSYPFRVHDLKPMQHMQADTLYITQPIAKDSRVQYAFVLVDKLTRYAFVYPMRSTDTTSAIRAFESIWSQSNHEAVILMRKNMERLTTDKGSEFSTAFTDFLLTKQTDSGGHIEHDQAIVGDKKQLSFVETAIRTIREITAREEYLFHKADGIGFWRVAEKAYNDHSHARLKGASPKEALSSLDTEYMQKDYEHRTELAKDSANPFQVKIGDWVRVRLREAKLNPLYKASYPQYGDDVYRVMQLRGPHVVLARGKELNDGNFDYFAETQANSYQVKRLEDVVIIQLPLHHFDRSISARDDSKLDHELKDLYERAGIRSLPPRQASSANRQTEHQSWSNAMKTKIGGDLEEEVGDVQIQTPQDDASPDEPPEDRYNPRSDLASLRKKKKVSYSKSSNDHLDRIIHYWEGDDNPDPPDAASQDEPIEERSQLHSDLEPLRKKKKVSDSNTSKDHLDQLVRDWDQYDAPSDSKVEEFLASLAPEQEQSVAEPQESAIHGPVKQRSSHQVSLSSMIITLIAQAIPRHMILRRRR